MAEAIYEKVSIGEGSSFAWREFRERFTMPWHFHPEYELTHIVSGQGMRHVGDSIERFGPGDFVLLGRDLPHYWWQSADDSPGRSIVLQFAGVVPGADLWSLPEFKQIGALLARSQRGVWFPSDGSSAETIPLLHELKLFQGWRRIQTLLDILGRLSEAGDYRLLASTGFSPGLKIGDGTRMEAVCGYVNATFHETISHAKAARLAGLSPSAFSRFFRRRAGRTFEAYVNEVRVGHACHLLEDEDVSVTEVAFRVGFNNLANFNRRFRHVTGMPPRDYRGLRRQNAAR